MNRSADLDRDQVPHVSPAARVAGEHEPQARQRLAVLGIGDQHLLALEMRVQLADRQRRRIAVLAAREQGVLQRGAASGLVDGLRCLQ